MTILLWWFTMPDSSYAVSEQNSRGRQYPVAPTRDRSAFQRDYTRLVHSHSFRRLQGKTQVFPAEWFQPSPIDLLHKDYCSVPGYLQALRMSPSDTHRTRMSHSIEVEQISRSLARALNLNSDLAGTLAVGHDIGHPPFGHTGQDALNSLFADVGGFEHNHHALLLVDKIESPYQEHPGLNLMFETREGLLKHCSLERAKLLGPVAGRHFTGESPPLEVQAVDAADQIAYLFGDLEDAVDRFVLSPDQLSEQYWFRDAWAKAQPGIPIPTVEDLIDPNFSQTARSRL
jgi:dGTPase